MGKFSIKRVYDPVEANDGFRILVDRLWPRGIKKEKAQIDSWLKEIAPAPALRRWFDHDPGKWTGFSKAYWQQLKQSPAIEEILEKARAHKKVTLLYAARDRAHNHAVILQRYLEPMDP
jgi:uncharacterized protein YeaO (DUF488 family)